jgi:hypothetical protein
MCFFAILRYKVDSVIAMRPHNVLEVLFTIALFAGTPVRVWSQNAPGSARAGCESVGSIGAVCFTAPNSQRGWIYESYFFEINGTPINLELNYQRTSQNASEYRAILDKLVESLEAPRH